MNGWIAQLDVYQDFLVGVRLPKEFDSAWINLATGGNKAEKKGEEKKKREEIYNMLKQKFSWIKEFPGVARTEEKWQRWLVFWACNHSTVLCLFNFPFSRRCLLLVFTCLIEKCAAGFFCPSAESLPLIRLIPQTDSSPFLHISLSLPCHYATNSSLPFPVPLQSVKFGDE